MVAAVSEVNSDRLGLRESVRLYNVPLETLRRWAKGMVTMDCRPGPKTVLRWRCANLMRFITLQVALFSVQWYFVQACSSMHFVLSIDKHRL